MLSKRVKKDSKLYIKNAIKAMLHNKISEIKDMILSDFMLLDNYILSSNSRMNFNYFYSIFYRNLNNFKFLEMTDKQVELSMPDMDSFDFKDIEFIEVILNGLIGVYAEASSVDMAKLYGNAAAFTPINPKDSTGDFIYLVPVNLDLYTKEKTLLGHTLSVNPFSNTTPLYNTVFARANTFVNENLDAWVEDTIKDSQVKIQQMFGGSYK